MLLKCPRCNNSLKIIGFEGSAVHTLCVSDGCMSEAKPRSIRPPSNIISKKRWGGNSNVPVVYKRATHA